MSKRDEQRAAERAVLGACIIEPAHMPEVREVLGAGQAFATGGHREIWRAIDRLHATGRTIDLLTVNAELGEGHRLVAYISALTDGVPRSANAIHYARLVQDAYVRRRLGRMLSSGADVGEIRGELDVLEGLQTGPEQLPLTTLDQVAERHIDMIWRPYLPAGFLTIVAGHPGHGKSSALRSLAAAMTRGDALPGTTSVHEPSRVAWLTLEEHHGAIVRPAFRAHDADLAQIDILDVAAENVDSYLHLNSPRFLRLLERCCETARLVVIDSISAWAIVDLNKGEVVRALLQPIADVLGRHPNAACAIIAHYRKLASSSAIEKVAGSIQGAATVRSLVTCTKVTKPREQHYWAHAKNNLGALGPSRAFQLHSVDLEVDGFSDTFGRVTWGDVEEVTADELVQAAAEQPDDKQATDDADDGAELVSRLLEAADEDLHPELRGDGILSFAWVAKVAADVPRMSGKPRSPADTWWVRPLKAVGVAAARQGSRLLKRRVPGLKHPGRFLYLKDLLTAEIDNSVESETRPDPTDTDP